MNTKLVKVIGLLATLISVGANLATNWVNDQKMNEKIDERVNEVLSNKGES